MGAAYCLCQWGFSVVPRLHCLVDAVYMTTCQCSQVFISGIFNVRWENELIISPPTKTSIYSNTTWAEGGMDMFGIWQTKPNYVFLFVKVSVIVTTYSSCTFFYLSCLFAHYRKVLTHRCASSHLSSLQQDFCFSLVLFFHGPASRPHLSLCLALRQNMKCALAESLCLWVSRPVGSRAEGLNPPHSLQIICG